MTHPRASAPSLASRWLRPRVVFPVFAVLLVISVLFSPRNTSSDAAPRLTIESHRAGGASGFAAALRRFGLVTDRSVIPISDSIADSAIHALLVPASAITAAETHVLLERVRAGLSVLAVFSRSGALADSLHLTTSRVASLTRGGPADTLDCRTETALERRFRTLSDPLVAGLRPNAPLPYDTVHFAVTRASTDTSDRGTLRSRPAILGLKVGRGRIVLVSGASLLTNDVMRQCRLPAGVAAMRAMEWLSHREGDGARSVVVFHEYYFGYGRHASVSRSAGEWLGGAVSGRVVLQLAIAALLLLWSAAPRAIAPAPIVSLPRRSPLEHVGALARAYEQVAATQTAARRLVQGLRRRALRATATHSVTDEEFLAETARRLPATRADAARVVSALKQTVTPAELIAVAESIDHLEQAIHR